MAVLEEWPWHGVDPKPGEHENWSIAVSLKRLADAQPTLRDQFAMRVLAAFAGQLGRGNAKALANEAYAVADAMLEARRAKVPC